MINYKRILFIQYIYNIYNNYSMKALTSLLMSLYILSFILCNVTSNADETVELNQTAGGDSKEETEEEKNARILREDIKKALTDMGAADAETITKEQFKKVFTQVMDKADDASKEEINQVMSIIAEKMLRTVPDVVPVNTIADYFSPRNMAAIFTEYLSELGANFDLVSMIDQYDEKKKEGKSTEQIEKEIEEDLIKKEKIKEQQNWYKEDKGDL